MGQELDRREFLGRAAGLAGAMLAGNSLAAGETATAPASRPATTQPGGMGYTRLGRTGFMTSRLVFGAGGLFSRETSLRILEYAIERGVNNIDTGRAYTNSEASIAPVVKRHRDRLWITSKAGHIGWPDMRIQPGQDAKAAELYTTQLEESLRALNVDTIDCYMVQGVEHEWVVTMDALYAAFEKARQAGKVRYFGLATHTNIPTVCKAAAETGRYDVIMLSVHPGSLASLSDTLQTMRKAGIGIISMKTSGQIRDKGPDFEKLYGQQFAGRNLSPYQRAYAYLLGSGKIDAFNSHMPNLKILEENINAASLDLAAAEWNRLEPLAVAEACGACVGCGQCIAACPAGRNPAAAVRRQAYTSRYLAAEAEAALATAALTARGGACQACGSCSRVCPAGIDVSAAVQAAEIA